ncbi:DUF4345 domain-containing protein [uncultured Arthrobacter sp.]|uniref:DUF4345 domain-containing protein n=1 Tax=uncultured Arthrobacter sp. TaxID=114050 RepID=UPI00260A8701|nr:DUF4345 family protein [uncultured Arthrobacter sp.]
MTSTSPENHDPSPAGRPAATGSGSGAGRSAGSATPGSATPGTPPATGRKAGKDTGRSAGTDRKQAGVDATGTPGDRRTGKVGSKDRGSDWSVFRTVVILVGLVLAGFGAYYLILGSAGLPDTGTGVVNPTLESQFRFFSAMMIGVGAAFITIAVKFQWANMLWLVCLMVFIGGIGRVLSWAFSGTPNYIMIILMVVELAFPPALLVWHKFIAKTSELRREFDERA